MTLTGCLERLLTSASRFSSNWRVFSLCLFFFFLPHSPHVVRWDSHLGNSMPVLLSREWQWRETKALRDSWIFSILSCRERSLTGVTSFVKMALKAHNYGKCHIPPRSRLENVSLVFNPAPPPSFYSSLTATTPFFSLSLVRLPFWLIPQPLALLFLLHLPGPKICTLISTRVNVSKE